ncbi:MAG: hypothetical protein J0665_20580 [Deltaproteobacteria bacterium]|nr:hypothetical protein [Deltaproteobacteria bacterium]
MPRTFMPQATVVIPTNSNLVVNDQDKPMLNRIFIVLFRHQVVNPDGDLLARLVANEQPGIFNWLAIGAKRCYEEGLGDNPFVKYSAEIQKKVKTRVTVTVEGFVKDFCDTDDRLTVSGADLLCAYTEYQAQEFDSNPDLSATAMGEALGKAGFISREDRSRKPSVTMRCGIQLNAAGKALLASYNAKLYVESPPTGSVDGSSAEKIEKVGAAQSVAEKAEAPKAKSTSKTGKKDSKK